VSTSTPVSLAEPVRTDLWELRIYIAGQSPQSLAALSNLRRICERHLRTGYRLEVIDLLCDPELAGQDQIVALPTTLRTWPLPRKKIAGDLTNDEEVLLGLELPAMPPEGEDLVRAISTGQVDAFVQRNADEDHVVVLQGTEEPYRLLVESMNEGALTLAQDGTILYCNSPFVAMANVPREQIIGTPFQSYVRTEERPHFEALLAQGLDSSSRGEFTLELSDGRKMAVQLSFHVEPCLKVPAVALLVSDIAELKRTAEALEKSRCEQLRLKDEFLSHVSHELRSPLTAASLFISILTDEVAGPLNGEQREYTKVIARNLHQLNAMIDDLLEMTRAEAGKLMVQLQWTPLDSAIAEVAKNLSPGAKEKEIVLNTELPEGLPLVDADPARLRQILTNLVQNAVKFTASGQITVRARLLETDRQFVLVEVEDTGCGLPPEAAEKVFERLYQAPTASEAGRKGLGIGLYICRELVQRQGGKIWVTSKPGAGSRFSFTLPVASLRKLIEPLIPALETERSLALVTISVTWKANAHKDLPNRLCHELRELISRCTLPDRDVLLPRTGNNCHDELCFILAVANEVGAGVLSRRLHGQLHRWEHIQHTGLAFSVSYKFLDLSSRDAEACGDDLLQIAVRRVEEAMQAERGARVHEHQESSRER
jgi:PAS domain S-box-containing protein